MDGISVDRLRCGEVVALFAPVAEALATVHADGVRHLAALIIDALLGQGGVPVGWTERAFALGVPAGLVIVLAAAVAEQPERRPTAAEVATALRETCDPLPLDRLFRPARSSAPTGASDR